MERRTDVEADYVMFEFKVHLSCRLRKYPAGDDVLDHSKPTLKVLGRLVRDCCILCGAKYACRLWQSCMCFGTL
jgi:hypothetical protein